MVAEKFKKAKEEAKAQVKKAVAVSVTADMWTSMNMDAYLAVTCHFINEGTLNTVLLGVQEFPQAHTAANLAAVKASIMEEWGITHKVTSLVTDAAANMLACARELNLKHSVCIAHVLNLMVKKALDQTPGLPDLRTKARKLVSLFRCSTTAKERLVQMQLHLGKTHLKLLQEVETRWNSTFLMFQRLHELREAVGATMASLQTDTSPLTSEEYFYIGECLGVLSPFYEATVELCEEKQVSASKIIPLLKMVDHALSEEMGKKTSVMAKQLAEMMMRQLREKMHNLQSMSILTLPTLLDPRFKTLGFLSPSKGNEAVKRLTSECAFIISHETPPPTAQAVPPQDEGSSTTGVFCPM
ncbi:E3 SUMO-protein ligase ZBED1-like [Paramisgurnus dabryanus]|uniref:E3 SUMO-protein ligase ZBED1-like n=1 Tax=Paramisgurnus dabryanus TaxID=90735 RepID=UPI003CCFB050